MHKVILLFISIHASTDANIPNATLSNNQMCMNQCMEAFMRGDSNASSIINSCKALFNENHEKVFSQIKNSNDFETHYNNLSESREKNLRTIISSMTKEQQILAEQQAKEAQVKLKEDLAKCFAAQIEKENKFIQFLKK
jgi:hypothetical protein